VRTTRRSRRTFLGAAGELAVAAACTLVRQSDMTTLVTFGDLMLDSGRSNAYGLTPGQLLVSNDDRLFRRGPRR
jgi:hypothetical protein